LTKDALNVIYKSGCEKFKQKKIGQQGGGGVTPNAVKLTIS
jgi:hypothetical protein